MKDFYVDSKFRVRYAETDAMRIVHHSSYIVWFEEGRSEFMRKIGLPYSKVEESGYFFTVVEVRAQYKHPAVYDEEVIVRTRLVEVKNRKVIFYYEVLRAEDERLLARGKSIHVSVDKDNRVVKIPQDYKALLSRFVSAAKSDL